MRFFLLTLHKVRQIHLLAAQFNYTHSQSYSWGAQLAEYGVLPKSSTATSTFSLPVQMFKLATDSLWYTCEFIFELALNGL